MAAERLVVVADFVEPCHVCGAACGGTVLVSYRDGGGGWRSRRIGPG